MNDDGTLYLINKRTNQVEVFYGADMFSGYGRIPDFVYDAYSTPPIFPGEMLDLHIESGRSLATSGGTRFYVGTALGATRFDANDLELDGYDGYGAGLDSYGLVTSYGIVGSGADFEVIGGTIPRVSSISSDEDNLILSVVTNDGYGSGGVTQITLVGNVKVAFMTKAGGFLPSDDVRDIFGKGF
jgi:hypothetical protein